MNIAFCVFAKYPTLGTVKTRLAKTTGDEFALQAYKSLFSYTLTILQSVSADVHFFVTPTTLDGLDYPQHLQHGQDLGERMRNASKELFQLAYEAVIFIGTDCVEIHEQHLQQSIEALKNNDVVIGPAHDGGYYLLGIKGAKDYLFADMAWSTDQLYTQTINKTIEHGDSVCSLETLSDIDEWLDLKPHLSKLNLESQIPQHLK